MAVEREREERMIRRTSTGCKSEEVGGGGWGDDEHNPEEELERKRKDA